MKEKLIRAYLKVRYCIVPFLFVKDEALMDVAVKLYCHDWNDMAFLYARKAAEAIPDNEEVLWKIAIYFGDDHPEVVIGLYESYFKRNPEPTLSEGPLRFLVGCYNALRRYDEALLLVKGFNDACEKHSRRVDIYCAKEEFKSALTELNFAFENAAEHQKLSLYYKKLNVLEKLDSKVETFETINELIEFLPATYSYILKSRFFQSEGKLEEALEIAHYALSIAKDDDDNKYSKDQINKIQAELRKV